ncbi:MAG: T9SS type A sorting domain-containing protein [Bacteroides sp.]|nr:T9SS type A sorting domain-containing protein [Bacteroides sp.]MCM1085546.1 T9SS type A sorting domain-containing protein [Bacteroides sp.]
MKLKRNIVLFLFALLASGFTLAGTVRTEDAGQKAPHRKIYAFFLANYKFGLGDFGIGSFYADKPQKTELWQSFKSENSFFAGAAANGMYYGLSYLYLDAAPPQPEDLIAVDMQTGEKHAIGPWAEDVSMRVQDMTYSYKDSTMYAISYDYEGEVGNYPATRLFTVDLKTGKMNKKVVLDTVQFYHAIAADYTGHLYVIGRDGVLYEADKQTGKVKALCKTPYGSPTSFWGAEVDHTDNMLYWAAISQDFDTARNYHLIQFDLNANPVTYKDLGVVADAESKAVLYGLYIPFVLGGEDAPAAPENVSVIPDPSGALKATLQWTTPKVDFGGKELQGLQQIKIWRNGKEVATLPATEIGKKMTWEDDNVPEYGPQEYVLVAVNAQGEGEKAYIHIYVGPDAPAKVKGLKVNKKEGCKELQIVWEKTRTGANNGYVNPEEISYRIVRFPDSIVVADNLKDTVFTDTKIEVLDGYSYEIYSVNKEGESSVLSNVNVAGPAMDPTYYFTDFISADTMAHSWTTVDNNKDGWTFDVSTMYGGYQFLDDLTALEYFINPMINPAGTVKDADDYFVSPPFLFKANTVYRVAFDYRCVSNETFEITVGKTNDAEGQTLVKKMVLEPSHPYVECSYVEVELPALEEDGIRAVGLHLVSPVPVDYYSFLQITDLYIDEVGPVAVEGRDALEDVQVSCNYGEIRIDGAFDYAEVYSVNGQKKAKTVQPVLNVKNLAQGVYLVRVARGQDARTFKVVVL